MNLNITSITFSQDLLFTINKFPRLVKTNSEATYRIRFIPHRIGEIRTVCTISTNMGIIEYQVRFTRYTSNEIICRSRESVYQILMVWNPY